MIRLSMKNNTDKETTMNTTTDPRELNELDKDVITYELGTSFWRAYQGLDLDSELVKESFRLALDAEADVFEPSDADVEAFAKTPGLTYETIPQVRQTACERTAAAIRVLVGFSEVRDSRNRSW